MEHFIFRLPDMGEGLAEAEIAQWHVQPGGAVREDAPLVDIMTDKATVEIVSPVSGVVVALHGAVGDKRPIGSELVVLDVTSGSVRAAAPAPADDPPRAAPATRRLAQELGIDLRNVPATGTGGSVTPEDLRRYADSRDQAGAAKPEGAPRTAVEAVPVIGLRRAIAEHLQDSWRRVPHFSYIEEVDMTAVETLRNSLNESCAGRRPRLTLLPFLLRALVVTLPEFPMLNALYDDSAGIVHRHAAVHVGIATQTSSGLVVPVLRNAEALSPWETARELSRLATAAREGKALRSELSGSTITITSLGALGGLATTPIVNAPEVAVIGVNRMRDQPAVRDGQIVIRRVMNLSSSFDHRVVDGWDAAAFIQAVRQRLEVPATLFLDLGR